MAQLVIQLSGEILSSNFDEWKSELIARIRAVNTELKTDPQFIEAANDVKLFKAAEQTLKGAKESAINQAADIQRLFAAIDEVSNEVRSVRLSLERQIKQRKLEIKEEFIEFGMNRILDYIERQGADFQSIDHSAYMDRDCFFAAAKGRATVNGLNKAITLLCRQIKSQIDERVAWVKRNAASLDSLPNVRRALFQDRGTLLALSPDQLESVIDERIEIYERELARDSDTVDEFETEFRSNDPSSNLESDDQVENQASNSADKSLFDLTLRLYATDVEADRLLEELESAYAGVPAVLSIHLDEK